MDMYNLESLSHFIQAAQDHFKEPGDQEPSPVQRSEQADAQSSHYDSDPVWQQLGELYQNGIVVHCLCTGWNRGGLLVRWQDLQGFVPASQLRKVPVFHGDRSRDEVLARWVGEELELKIIELDPSRNRLVFSERATQWAPKEGERLLKSISPGDVREGSVSNLCDFGAFVDLGGIDGLIHISELSWGRVSHPSNLLDIGEKVRVYVIDVDQEHERVALSLKRLHENPWSLVEERYGSGDVVEATVTNVVNFGAFAQIEEGLEGLIHISELAEERIGHPTEVVDVGDHVLVRILDIDSDNHRLSLSVRQAPGQHESAPEKDVLDGGQDDESATLTFLY